MSSLQSSQHLLLFITRVQASLRAASRVPALDTLLPCFLHHLGGQQTTDVEESTTVTLTYTLVACAQELKELISSYQTLRESGRGPAICNTIIETARQCNLDKDIKLPEEDAKDLDLAQRDSLVGQAYSRSHPFTLPPVLVCHSFACPCLLLCANVPAPSHACVTQFACPCPLVWNSLSPGDPAC